MQQDKEQFLNLKNPPARLTAEEAAWFLGFSPHDIPMLVNAGLLKPLGHPPANGPKYFAMVELEELRRDRKWLAKASNAVVGYWQNRNSRKSFAPDHQSLSQRVTSANPVA